MLIAVSADGRDLSSAVSQKFDACLYLLLIETDNMTITTVENEGKGAPLAQIIAASDCEAVITGSFTPEVFNIIADACITRYKGDDLTVKEALDLMDKNKLDYIRYADENDTCHGDHSGGECNCGEDD